MHCIISDRNAARFLTLMSIKEETVINSFVCCGEGRKHLKNRETVFTDIFLALVFILGP
jgi:hypothetical protein